MMVSVGFEISISDLTSEMLPKDPLIMIFPLIEEDTNMSLKYSLLIFQRSVLRLLFQLVLGVMSNYFVESNYLSCFYLSCYFWNQASGVYFRICCRKSDLSYLNNSSEFQKELTLVALNKGSEDARLRNCGYFGLVMVRWMNFLSFLKGLDEKLRGLSLEAGQQTVVHWLLDYKTYPLSS